MQKLEMIAKSALEAASKRRQNPDLTSETERRAADALSVRGRLPSAVRSCPGRELLERIQRPELRRVALEHDPWRSGGLVLLGPTGLGKSSAAAVVFRRLLRRGIRTGGAEWGLAERLRWYRATELEAADREHPLGAGYSAPDIRAAIGASLLVLDDLGHERDRGLTARILSERYDSGRPTLITSGWTARQLNSDTAYGPSVTRRMVESGGVVGQVIEIFC